MCQVLGTQKWAKQPCSSSVLNVVGETDRSIVSQAAVSAMKRKYNVALKSSAWGPDPVWKGRESSDLSGRGKGR